MARLLNPSGSDYAQRASAGLILSEATSVSPMGVGYADTPGIWSSEQVKGWKLVTEAVHKAGGRIMLQLWHVGRISDPMFLNGALPVAPSAIAPAGHISLVRPLKPFVTPRALELKQIPFPTKRDAERAGSINLLLTWTQGLHRLPIYATGDLTPNVPSTRAHGA